MLKAFVCTCPDVPEPRAVSKPTPLYMAAVYAKIYTYRSCYASGVTALLLSADYQDGVNVDEHAGSTSRIRHLRWIVNIDPQQLNL